MYSKHFGIGFLMLLGIASGVTACGGVNEAGSAEEWAGDDELSSQSSIDDVDSTQAVASTPPTVPDCGIIACPAGTVCRFVYRFDRPAEARCVAPDAQSCDVVSCGAYHYCVMTDVGAVCMPGAADS